MPELEKTSSTDASDEPTDVQEFPRKRNVVAVLLIAFAVGTATLTPALVGLPVLVADVAPDNKESVLGMVLGVNAFLGMALAPLFGAVSDRTTSRFGRRRPGMAFGAVGVVTGLLVLSFASNVPMILIGTFAMGVGAAASGASSFALIPDLFPDSSRGRILGFKTLVGSAAGMLASIVGPIFLDNQVLLFGVGAVVLAISYPIALSLIDDTRLDPSLVPQQSLLRTAFSGYVFNPKSAPDFSWVFASRFVFTLGIAFGSSFAVYFLTDQLHITGDDLAPLISLNAIMSLGGVAVGTLIGAFLADKAGSRKQMVLVCSIALAVGVTIAAFAPSAVVFFAGTAIVTLAIGMFIPTDGALVMSVLPGGSAHAAKFMSIITIADQLPRSVGPLIAPAVIGLGGYTALGGYPVLYLTAAVAALAGGLIVRKVKSVR